MRFILRARAWRIGGKVTCSALGDLRVGSYLGPAGMQWYMVLRWSSNHRPSVEMVVKVLGNKVVVRVGVLFVVGPGCS